MTRPDPHTTPARLGIINRVTPGTPYPLGQHLHAAGTPTALHHLHDLTLINGHPHDRDEPLPTNIPYLWRLSENTYPATRTLLTAFTTAGITLINPAETISTCADKLTTLHTLHTAGLPIVPAHPAYPGNPVPAGYVAKPVYGAGGRDILHGPTTIPADTLEPWLIQPHAGNDADFIRILIVAGTIIATYRRIPAPGAVTNNIETGGTRHHLTAPPDLGELALAAANTMNAMIAGIDVTAHPYRILEINSTPGLPPDTVPAVAAALHRHLHQ
jgi:glutathione synthase/RimK-type ligase-like ATP-grasp enzyme